MLCNRRLKINISINQSIHISCYKQTFQLFHLTKLGCLVSFCGLYICLILSIVEWLELMIAQGLWYLLVATHELYKLDKNKWKKKNSLVFFTQTENRRILEITSPRKSQKKQNKKPPKNWKFGLSDFKWFPSVSIPTCKCFIFNNPITLLGTRLLLCWSHNARKTV